MHSNESNLIFRSPSTPLEAYLGQYWCLFSDFNFFPPLCLAVSSTTDSEAPTQTAKTTPWASSCWASSWQTTSPRTTPPAGSSTRGRTPPPAFGRHRLGRVSKQICSVQWTAWFCPSKFRYIQSLTGNLSFVRYKEIHVAAAEIIGLTLKNLTDVSEV